MTFVRYVAIQVLAYVIDMGVFLVILRSEVFMPLVANILGKVAAGVFAFVAHRVFTFRVAEKASKKHQAIRYFALLGLNIPLSSAVLYLMLVYIANPVVAKFISDVVCLVLTYSLSKHFVFVGKHKKPKKVKGGKAFEVGK